MIVMWGYSVKAWWMGTSVPIAVTAIAGILVGVLVVIAIVTVAYSVKRAAARGLATNSARRQRQ